MNVMVYEVGSGELSRLNHHSKKLVVEDNIGEAIHIHVRNFRLEMPVEDFFEFGSEIREAVEVLDDGDH